MQAHVNKLPPHLAPLAQKVMAARPPQPVSLCKLAPDEPSLAAYPGFYELVRLTGSQRKACEYLCQDRRNGHLLIRPDFLGLYQQRIRPLTEAESNLLRLFGRNNRLTISLFMRFHREDFLHQLPCLIASSL